MFQKESSGMVQVMQWRLLPSLSSPAVAVQGQFPCEFFNIFFVILIQSHWKKPQKTKTETGPRSRNQDFLLLEQAL